MTTTLNLKPKAVSTQEASAEGAALQEYIDALIAEAAKKRPPPLSAEEQRNKNQAAIEMLRQWCEEDATDDPEVIAQSLAEWEEFKKGMNENHSSGRIIYP